MHLIMLQWLSKSVIVSWANSAVSVYSQPIPTVRKVHQLVSLIPCLNLQPYMFLLCSCGAQAETSGKSSSLCNWTVFSPAFLSCDKTSTKLLFWQVGIWNVSNSKDALNVLLIFPEFFNAENIEFLPVDVGQQPIRLPDRVSIWSSTAVSHQVNTITWQ